MGVVGQPSVESGVKWEGESLRQKDLKQQAWETWGVEEQQAAKSGGTWEGKLCSQGKPLHLSGGTEGEEEQQDMSDGLHLGPRLVRCLFVRVAG